MKQFPEFTEICPEGVHEKIIQVTESMSDSAGYMHPAELARQMQTITEEHFDHYAGMTIHMLQEAGLSWVISWTQMHIVRLPEQGETIRLRIWVGKKKAVLHTRKYAFYTMTGEPLVTTASLFLLMDRESRRVAADPEGMREIQPVVIPGEPNAPKMNVPFPEDYESLSGRTVESNEIDYNGHLNNSYYLDWTEILPEENFLQNHMIHSIWIEYTQEMKEGDTAGMYYTIGENTIYIRGVSRNGQTFRVCIDCEPDSGAHLKRQLL